MLTAAKKRLAINAPVSMNFCHSFRRNSLTIIGLEARYAVEEALSNCEMDDEGNILSMPVNLALARNPSNFSSVCYGSYHTPHNTLPDDFIVNYTVEARQIVDRYFATGGSGENELIMEIAQAILPEFRRRSNLALIQDAAKQSNILDL